MSDNLFEGLESLLKNPLLDNDDSDDLINPELITTDEPLIPDDDPKAKAKGDTDTDDLIDLDDTPAAAGSKDKKGEGDIIITPDNSGKDGEGDSSSLYKNLATVLSEQGVLPALNVEEFDGTLDGLKEAIYNEGIEMIEDFKSQLPKEIKTLIDNWQDNVPLDELIYAKSNQMKLSSITEDTLEENVDLQKNLVRSYLKSTTSFSDAKIEKELTRLEDLGDLDVEAKEALTELKEIESQREEEIKAKAAQAKIAKEAEDRKLIEDLKNKISETKEIIPNIKLTEKEKRDLYEAMTAPVATDKNGNNISKVMEAMQKDPIGFNTKLHYFIMKGFFEGNFDTITTKLKTNAVKELERSLETTSFKTGKSGVSGPTSTDKLLKSISKTFGNR